MWRAAQEGTQAEILNDAMKCATDGNSDGGHT